MEKYCDTNLNYYIKIKLTEEGRIIYKKHYANYNCETPKLNIDDEGYMRFQIHDFMNIFGERLFMGATLPCETNCKIQVKDEWHYVKDGNLPTTVGRRFLVSNRYCTMVGYWNGKTFVSTDDEGTVEIASPIAWCELPKPPEFPKESVCSFS